MYKILILTILISFSSCASWNVTTEYDFYNSPYNYNQIHRLYMSNPTWFYNNYYLDPYGQPTYYHRHPHYIRYQRECIRRASRTTPITIPRVGTTHTNSATNRNTTSTATRRAPINKNRTTPINRNTTTRTIRPTTRPPTRTITRTPRPSTSIRTATIKRNHQ